MAEMMTRAAKQLFRGAMRTADTQKQLRLVVVNTLNLLLGQSAASVSFYETVGPPPPLCPPPLTQGGGSMQAMQLQLRSKYGSYGEVFEAGADYRHSFDPTALFTRLTYVLGIRFLDLDTSKVLPLFSFGCLRPRTCDCDCAFVFEAKSSVYAYAGGATAVVRARCALHDGNAV
jgi:hypothetical protein